MNLLELFAPIKTFVFDVDGVLTDGSLMITEEGHMLRSMNIKDGFAINLAIKKGYAVWIISGGKSEAVRIRLNRLGVEEVHINIENKLATLHSLAIAKQSDLGTLLYMGDDLPDYAPMQHCHLPCCPADAVPEIKAIAKYISPIPGGKGCVRDVIEKVLKLSGDWTYDNN